MTNDEYIKFTRYIEEKGCSIRRKHFWTWIETNADSCVLSTYYAHFSRDGDYIMLPHNEKYKSSLYPDLEDRDYETELKRFDENLKNYKRTHKNVYQKCIVVFQADMDTFFAMYDSLKEAKKFVRKYNFLKHKEDRLYIKEVDMTPNVIKKIYKGKSYKQYMEWYCAVN